MTGHFVTDTKNGFTVKIWRGERTFLLGFDVVDPEPDFVGFAIDWRYPGTTKISHMKNRMAFEYKKKLDEAVTGDETYDSRDAPFQAFRWVHFPRIPKPGVYTYGVTKRHMRADGSLADGTRIQLPIEMDVITYHDFIDVGFTRGFASSQAFRSWVPKGMDVDTYGGSLIPVVADDGPKFPRPTFADPDHDVYR